MIVSVVIFCLVYVLMFLGFCFNFMRALKRKKHKDIMQLEFFITKYDLKRKDVDAKRLLIGVAMINAFIIAFVGTLVTVSMPKEWFGYIMRLLIAFVLMFVLIYALYEIYGRHLVRKWGKK